MASSTIRVGVVAGAIASASAVLASNPASTQKSFGSLFGLSSSAPALEIPAPVQEQQEKPRNGAPRTSAVHTGNPAPTGKSFGSLFGLSSTAPAPEMPAPAQEQQEKPRNDVPRTSAAGFDPEALERGAKALREINASVHAKNVFELMKKQEETRQAQENSRKAEYLAMQAQRDTERQRVMYEEQIKLAQQQANSKAQLARYEDELARQRMQVTLRFCSLLAYPTDLLE